MLLAMFLDELAAEPATPRTGSECICFPAQGQPYKIEGAEVLFMAAFQALHAAFFLFTHGRSPRP